ncbi:MAG: energy transducer TonB [Terriglobales bacterium]
MGTYHIVWALTALAAVAAAQQAPAADSNPWQVVALAEAPVALTSHSGALWLAGADEMVAESTDGGAHWAVRHHASGGQVLTGLAFAGDRTIYAMGSGHSWLVSNDGGEHWSMKHWPKLSWRDAAFATPKIGVAASSDAWGMTLDGGEHWSTQGLPLPADALQPPRKPGQPMPKTPILHTFNRRILAVAILDAQRAAVLFAPEEGGQPWASSTDGGKSWSQSGLDQQMQLTGMRAAGGKFWIYGASKADGSPMAMSTADAVNWTTEPAPPAVFSRCTAEGCLAPGGWADLAGGTAKFLALPPLPAEGAITAWAAADGRVCALGGGRLYCTAAQAGAWPTAGAAAAPLVVDYRDLHVTGYQPLELPASNHDGIVSVRLAISAEGRVTSEQVEAAEYGDLAASALKGLKLWRFAPVESGGKAVAAVVTIPYWFLPNGNVPMTHPGQPSAVNACCAVR